MKRTSNDRAKRAAITIAAASAILTIASAAPAVAQDYRYAAGYNAGSAWFSALNDGAGSGPQRIELDPGWILGLQFEEWHGAGRVGTRLNLAFTQRPLSSPGAESPDVAAWIADADAMLRLLPAYPEGRVNAYLGVGVGLVRYQIGQGEFNHFEDADATYPGRARPIPAAVGFAGLDIITGLRWDRQPVGIRIEAANHVTRRSPLEPADGGDFSPVHNMRIVIGVFSGFGRLR
jgi:hypothetical protein